MAKVPLYNINSLASANVGTPGVNHAGDMIAQSIASGAGMMMDASIAGQRQLRGAQINNLENAMQGLGHFMRARSAQANQQKINLENAKKKAEKHLQDNYDDRIIADGKLDMNDMFADLHNTLSEKYASNPGVGLDEFKKQGMQQADDYLNKGRESGKFNDDTYTKLYQNSRSDLSSRYSMFSNAARKNQLDTSKLLNVQSADKAIQQFEQGKLNYGGALSYLDKDVAEGLYRQYSIPEADEILFDRKNKLTKSMIAQQIDKDPKQALDLLNLVSQTKDPNSPILSYTTDHERRVFKDSAQRGIKAKEDVEIQSIENESLKHTFGLPDLKRQATDDMQNPHAWKGLIDNVHERMDKLAKQKSAIEAEPNPRLREVKMKVYDQAGSELYSTLNFAKRGEAELQGDIESDIKRNQSDLKKKADESQDAVTKQALFDLHSQVEGFQTLANTSGVDPKVLKTKADEIANKTIQAHKEGKIPDAQRFSIVKSVRELAVRTENEVEKAKQTESKKEAKEVAQDTRDDINLQISGLSPLLQEPQKNARVIRENATTILKQVEKAHSRGELTQTQYDAKIKNLQTIVKQVAGPDKWFTDEVGKPDGAAKAKALEEFKKVRKNLHEAKSSTQAFSNIALNDKQVKAFNSYYQEELDAMDRAKVPQSARAILKDKARYNAMLRAANAK